MSVPTSRDGSLPHKWKQQFFTIPNISAFVDKFTEYKHDQDQKFQDFDTISLQQFLQFRNVFEGVYWICRF